MSFLSSSNQSTRNDKRASVQSTTSDDSPAASHRPISKRFSNSFFFSRSDAGSASSSVYSGDDVRPTSMSKRLSQRVSGIFEAQKPALLAAAAATHREAVVFGFGAH
jgi:hypothetical protein